MVTMAPRREADEGAGTDRVPLGAVLSVFEERSDRARPVTASDVMEAVGCSRRTAHNKLNELVEEGVLETRKVGSRSRVWWVPISAGEVADVGSASRAPVDVDAVDLPGTGKTLRARQEALLAAYEYLQEYPEAKKSDFLQDVFPENPAEYETAEGWWNAIQPALAELPGVDPPEERGHIWHFLGG
jgi:DNA-binding Lrp family transcriptional regulator